MVRIGEGLGHGFSYQLVPTRTNSYQEVADLPTRTRTSTSSDDARTSTSTLVPPYSYKYEYEMLVSLFAESCTRTVLVQWRLYSEVPGTAVTCSHAAQAHVEFDAPW